GGSPVHASMSESEIFTSDNSSIESISLVVIYRGTRGSQGDAESSRSRSRSVRRPVRWVNSSWPTLHIHLKRHCCVAAPGCDLDVAAPAVPWNQRERGARYRHRVAYGDDATRIARTRATPSH